MKYDNHYVSASIKKNQYLKLVKLAKKEKHTISDQLEIILSFYKRGII